LTFYELNCISLHKALADNLRAFYSEVLFSFQVWSTSPQARARLQPWAWLTFYRERGVRHQLIKVFEDPSVAY